MINLSEAQKSKLRAGALSAIWYSHIGTFTTIPGYTGARPPEEDFVAMFIYDGLKRLESAWKPLLTDWNMSLSMTGVFCHQTPKAKFKLNTCDVSPEIGDILIVRKHTSSAGETRQVASIIQVKMSSDDVLSLSTNGDLVQLYLLENWPSFELSGKKAPSGSFYVGKAERQCAYALIHTDRHYPEDNVVWPDSCSWVTLPPENNCQAEKSFASFLVDTINFEEGRHFYSGGNTGCDWSSLINYMLSTTFNMPLKTRDWKPANTIRGKDICCFYGEKDVSLDLSSQLSRLCESVFSGGGAPDEPSPLMSFEESGQGRVIIIETKEVLPF